MAAATLVGIGLRAGHAQEFLERKPPIGWLEVHSENYFVAGGALRAQLERVRADYPLSLHGVGLSLGSSDALDAAHVSSLATLVRRCEPLFVSEHLAWGSHDGGHFNDLLPLPYTAESLAHMVERVDALQESLGRTVLIENISSYLQFNCSSIPEWEFLAELAGRTGCGLLLDVNNVYVNSRNHGFDPLRFIEALPADAIREIHLAGHSTQHRAGQDLLVDTHDAPVCEAVWELFAATTRCIGARHTLVEWDASLPALDVLLGEADRALAIQAAPHAVAV